MVLAAPAPMRKVERGTRLVSGMMEQTEFGLDRQFIEFMVGGYGWVQGNMSAGRPPPSTI